MQKAKFLRGTSFFCCALLDVCIEQTLNNMWRIPRLYSVKYANRSFMDVNSPAGMKLEDCNHGLTKLCPPEMAVVFMPLSHGWTTDRILKKFTPSPFVINISIPYCLLIDAFFGNIKHGTCRKAT